MIPLKKVFNINDSLARIDTIISPAKSILNVDDAYDIEDLGYDEIVDADLLYISVLLKSDVISNLESQPNLLKQYKACLSEIIPILAESESLLDIDVFEFLNVVGVYSYKKDDNLNGIIDIVAKINSMCDVLNSRFEKTKMTRLTPGIGVTIAKTHIFRMTESDTKTDEILRISSGFNKSIEFSRIANTGLVKNPIIISSSIWNNLSVKYKQFFSYNESTGYYYASLVNILINNWLKSNR